jgi:hypothetical protein
MFHDPFVLSATSAAAQQVRLFDRRVDPASATTASRERSEFRHKGASRDDLGGWRAMRFPLFPRFSAINSGFCAKNSRLFAMGIFPQILKEQGKSAAGCRERSAYRLLDTQTTGKGVFLI